MKLEDVVEIFLFLLQIAELDLTNVATNAPVILIQSLKKNGDPTALQRSLAEHMPSNVIMYLADISAVRQIEVRVKLK